MATRVSLMMSSTVGELAKAALLRLGKGQMVEHTLNTSHALGNHTRSIPFTLRSDHSPKMDEAVGDCES